MKTPKYLSEFAEYFEKHKDSYAIIGGTALVIHLEQLLGDSPRATKDLDIVAIEIGDSASRDFLDAFVKYVETHKYKTAQLGSGKSQAFRFTAPEIMPAPAIIELLTARQLNLAMTQPVQRLEEWSISSIALDKKYTDLINRNRQMVVVDALGKAPVPIVNVGALVLLKAFAYENLVGKDDSKAKKHLNDVLRLSMAIDIEGKISAVAGTSDSLLNIVQNAETLVSASTLRTLNWSMEQFKNAVSVLL
jgi:hypothetical protein